MFENKFVKSLSPYVVTNQINFKKNNVLKLDWNEPTIQPSKKVLRAVKEFTSKGKLNHYPDLINSEFITLLASYSKVYKKNIQYFAGSDALQECIVKTFLGENDKVVLVSPTYDNFRSTAETSGAKTIHFFLKDNKKFDLNQFVDFISSIKPKAVYICNPNNPTGTDFSKTQLNFLFNKFKSTLFIIDEAYFEFYGKSISSSVKKFRNIIICRSFSKAFCLASFRIGYAIASSELITSLNKVRNPKSIPSLSQVAGIAALNDLTHTQEYVDEVRKAKIFFINEIKEIGNTKISLYEGHGNFILCKLNLIKVDELINFLKNDKIYIRNLSHVNGLKNHMRITIGTLKDMKRVSKKLTYFFMNNR